MPMESLASALRRLGDRGFTHDLRAEDGRLCDLDTGESLDPAQLVVDEVVRFEGETDPDEQAVLFALRSPGGAPLGTYATVFGPTVPPEDGEVLRRLGSVDHGPGRSSRARPAPIAPA